MLSNCYTVCKSFIYFYFQKKKLHKTLKVALKVQKLITLCLVVGEVVIYLQKFYCYFFYRHFHLSLLSDIWEHLPAVGESVYFSHNFFNIENYWYFNKLLFYKILRDFKTILHWCWEVTLVYKRNIFSGVKWDSRFSMITLKDPWHRISERADFTSAPKNFKVLCWFCLFFPNNA